MAYYRITIWLSDRTYQGIREYPSNDIDYVARYFTSKARMHFPKLADEDIEVVMVPRHSDEVQQYIASLHKTRKERHAESLAEWSAEKRKNNLP